MDKQQATSKNSLHISPAPWWIELEKTASWVVSNKRVVQTTGTVTVNQVNKPAQVAVSDNTLMLVHGEELWVSGKIQGVSQPAVIHPELTFMDTPEPVAKPVAFGECIAFVDTNGQLWMYDIWESSTPGWVHVPFEDEKVASVETTGESALVVSKTGRLYHLDVSWRHGETSVDWKVDAEQTLLHQRRPGYKRKLKVEKLAVPQPVVQAVSSRKHCLALLEDGTVLTGGTPLLETTKRVVENDWNSLLFVDQTSIGAVRQLAVNLSGLALLGENGGVWFVGEQHKLQAVKPSSFLDTTSTGRIQDVGVDRTTLTALCETGAVLQATLSHVEDVCWDTLSWIPGDTYSLHTASYAALICAGMSIYVDGVAGRINPLTLTNDLWSPASVYGRELILKLANEKNFDGETAVGLLGEWDGTIEELLEAASLVNANTV